MNSVLSRLSMAIIAGLAISSGARAESFTIDEAHADIGFSVRHLGVNNVRGRFDERAGHITYDSADPASLQARCTIQAKSVNTGIAKRDDHLRSADFLDVAQHPEITFVSTGARSENGRLLLDGTLTIRGVAKEITLECEISGPVDSPVQQGVKILGLSARGKINRHDFGVSWGGLSDSMVGSEVQLTIDVEAKLSQPAT
jgi:polyisoprenoid-binding protein YceI